MRRETLTIIRKNDKFYSFMSLTTSKVYSAPIACFSQEVITMNGVQRDADGSLSVDQDIACVIERKPDGKEFVYADHSCPDYTFLGKNKTALSPLRMNIIQNVGRMPASQQRTLSALIKEKFDGSEESVESIAEKAGLFSLENEHKKLEYKACPYDINPKVLPAICGFANAEGGLLVLGVEERDGRWTPCGCERCIERYGGQDKFSCMLRNMCRQQLSTPLFLDLEIGFRECQGHTLCEVTVPASKRPVFVSGELFVRVDNTTQHLKGDAILDYAMARMTA